MLPRMELPRDFLFSQVFSSLVAMGETVVVVVVGSGRAGSSIPVGNLDFCCLIFPRFHGPCCGCLFGCLAVWLFDCFGSWAQLDVTLALASESEMDRKTRKTYHVDFVDGHARTHARYPFASGWRCCIYVYTYVYSGFVFFIRDRDGSESGMKWSLESDSTRLYYCCYYSVRSR